MNVKSARIALSSIIAVSLLLASSGKEANAQAVLATNNVGQLTNAVPAHTQEQGDLPELRGKAEKGDPAAEFSLGKRYETGSGVETNQTEAVRWYRKAAEQGNAKAQCNLGDCYFWGWGVEKNLTEAVKWIRKAAEQGNAEAQFHLAVCYLSGSGVEKNLTESVKWCRKAAEQGNANAQVGLASSYYTGSGVESNLTEAVKWYRKAAEQGNALGQLFLSNCYFGGLGVEKNQTEAVKWYRKAAEQGNAEAQWSLATCYYNGWGIEKDQPEAANWYRKAAEQGQAGSQHMLGYCYAGGVGVPKDLVEAYKWFNLAASRGDTNAAEQRERLEDSMTPAQIAEAQRRSSAFVAKNEGGNRTDSTIQPNIPGIPRGNGTGFIIADGYFLTCNHVIADATAIKVVTGGVSYQAKLVKADAANDVALLKVDGLNGAVSVLPVLSSRDIRLGDPVFTIGFPNIDLQGVEPKLTRGEINSLAGIQDDPRFFQISVAVQPGNSGGALLDMHGNVIGIVAARLDEKITLQTSGMLPQNVNYALRSSFILAFLDAVPELNGKMSAPHTEKDRKFEDVIKEAQTASAMVLVY